MVDFGNLVLSHYRVTKAIFNYVDARFQKEGDSNIVILIFKSNF